MHVTRALLAESLYPTSLEAFLQAAGVKGE
jgi:hypothetical protein